MRLSTSSFSVRLAAFVGVLLAAACLCETYCRSSKRFSDFSFYYIKLLTEVDQRQAILGDSHVGVSQQMPGYAFLGQPGQQPAELLRLVRYLYSRTSPRRVIVQASPQWFGYYHWDRKPMLTSGTFAPNLFGFHFLIFSKTYQAALFDNLASEADAIFDRALPAAHAAVSRPTPEETLVLVQDWMKMAEQLGERFNWAQYPAEKRQLLTISRVYDQNPVQGFETSEAAADYEEAIKYLLARGAQVCLFRTPVTPQYIETEMLIPNSRYGQFDDYIERVAKTFSVPFVDFRRLPYKFDDSRFYNQDHMTGHAAVEVWPLVAKRCFGER